MRKNLEKEFRYYLKHQDDLVKQFDGKYIVIIDSEVIGVYNTEQEAYENTVKHHELGTFLIQKCESGVESYTQTFHSRVAFP